MCNACDRIHYNCRFIQCNHREPLNYSYLTCVIYFDMRKLYGFRLNDSAITVDNPQKGSGFNFIIARGGKRKRRNRRSHRHFVTSAENAAQRTNDSAWNTRRERHLLAPSCHADARFAVISRRYVYNTREPQWASSFSLPIAFPFAFSRVGGLYGLGRQCYLSVIVKSHIYAKGCHCNRIFLNREVLWKKKKTGKIFRSVIFQKANLFCFFF